MVNVNWGSRRTRWDRGHRGRGCHEVLENKRRDRVRLKKIIGGDFQDSMLVKGNIVSSKVT